ncbi:entericidin A/B family lipoprotein [Nitrincola sp. MINF-07-Sa-05]|uniref:entericidin A/B family lipoprotein n=1 Tax=Nitrincola salilacus TaxID=3400273 RepID=UPI00391862B8
MERFSALFFSLKSALLVLIIALPLGVTGCNTVEGLGKDIQKGGQAIERAGKK